MESQTSRIFLGGGHSKPRVILPRSGRPFGGEESPRMQDPELMRLVGEERSDPKAPVGYSFPPRVLLPRATLVTCVLRRIDAGLFSYNVACTK